MSAGIDDGGPAYPSARDMRHSPDFDHEPGMTLRDRIAIEAMGAQIGLLGDQKCIDAALELAQEAGVDFKRQIAIAAYTYADAMLAEREVKR